MRVLTVWSPETPRRRKMSSRRETDTFKIYYHAVNLWPGQGRNCNCIFVL